MESSIRREWPWAPCATCQSGGLFEKSASETLFIFLFHPWILREHIYLRSIVGFPLPTDSVMGSPFIGSYFSILFYI